MFDRISASFSLAKSSAQVLWSDKKLLVFPLISGFICLLVMISFIVPFAVVEGMFDRLTEEQNQWLMWVVLFLYYLCSYFVVIFFNSALISCAIMRFNGETATLGDGFRMAFARIPQIFLWALVSATVGVALRVIESMHERAGTIISAIIGTAWSVITYFVVPVLVVEKVGPFQAIQRSIAILKKTWGESLIGHFGIGLFTFLLLLPGIGLLIGGVFLLSAEIPVAVGITVIVLAIIYFIIWGAVSAALQAVFTGAIYQYATNGEIPSVFDRNVIENAFTPKPA